jgi:hypothetical protein
MTRPQARQRRGTQPAHGPMTPSVSVIVPGRNSAATLEACLAALRAQAWPAGRHEIVYADDGSTDASRQIAPRLTDRVVMAAGPPSAGAARNAGAAASTGDVLVFIDSDVVAPPGTVAALVRTLADDPGLAAVFGSYDAQPAHPALVSRFRNLLHHYVHQRSSPQAETFWAGCGAVRRDAFARMDGYDPACRIEDVDLGRRMRAAGMRIRLDRAVQVKHLKRWTLPGMIRSDVLDRGIPWCLLLLQGGRPRELGALNLTADGFASAALAWAAVLAAVAAPWTGPVWTLAAGAGFIALNLPFYRYLGKLRGPWFAVECIPLHFVHHLCGGAAAVAAVAIWAVRRPLGRRQPRALWLGRDG